MDLIIKTNTSYFGAGIQRELAAQRSAAGEHKLASDAEGSLAAQNSDKVNISSEARSLQQVLAGKVDAAELGLTGEEKDGGQRSNLRNVLSGNEEAIADNRLAYGGGGLGAAKGGSGEDDAAIRIRDLQKQLREALNHLQEARQELSEAQAENIAAVKAMQQGDDPDAAAVASQKSEQELTLAQQKVVSASAEVNAVQEQLQKMLVEQAQAAKGGASHASAAVGEVWEPQGTTNYIRSNW